MNKKSSRIALKQFRIGMKLTQQEIADKMSISKITYSSIERGDRNGKPEFWLNLQRTFCVEDDVMWKIQKRG